MKTVLTAVTNPLVNYAGEIIHHTSTEARMNPEEYLAWAARVSSPDNRMNSKTAPKLLKYLMDHKHWSPNEMVNFSFQIVTSRAIAQQILRHRSFSFQEFSQRYAEVTAMEAIELRYEHSTNRQSSTDVCTDAWLNAKVKAHLGDSQNLYKELINSGIAKECARMVLPLATETTMIMNGTLRSWIHFLEQRCDGHAQKEIQAIAFSARKQLSDVVPWTAKALGWV